MEGVRQYMEVQCMSTSPGRLKETIAAQKAHLLPEALKAKEVRAKLVEVMRVRV